MINFLIDLRCRFMINQIKELRAANITEWINRLQKIDRSINNITKTSILQNKKIAKILTNNIQDSSSAICIWIQSIQIKKLTKQKKEQLKFFSIRWITAVPKHYRDSYMRQLKLLVALKDNLCQLVENISTTWATWFGWDENSTK